MPLGPPREGPAELDGVEGDLLAPAGPVALDEGPARGAGEVQGERVTVATPPLGHHVGDESAVVLRGQRELPPGGVRDVDTVHPGVTGEDHVEDEGHAPRLGRAVDLLLRGHRAHDAGPPPPPRLRRAGDLHPTQELRDVEGAVLLDLECGEGVDHGPVPGPPGGGDHPGGHPAQAREALGHAQHVPGHGPDVPRRAVGRTAPLVGVERCEQGVHPRGLGRGEPDGLGRRDLRDVLDVDAPLRRRRAHDATARVTRAS